MNTNSIKYFFQLVSNNDKLQSDIDVLNIMFKHQYPNDLEMFAEIEKIASSVNCYFSMQEFIDFCLNDLIDIPEYDVMELNENDLSNIVAGSQETINKKDLVFKIFYDIFNI